MFFNRRNLFFVLLLLLFGVLGCAGHSPLLMQPAGELIWPGGEETPRIRYLTAIYGPEDLQISKNVFLRFWDYIVGREKSRLVAPYGLFSTSDGKLYVVDTFSRKVLLFDVVEGKFTVFPDEDNPLISPIDIVADEETGRIYISDSTEGVIRIFDDPVEGGFFEIGRGLLKRPTGVAINHITGELLAVDTKLSTLFRFDLRDHSVQGQFGDKGVQPGQFNNPTHICIAHDGSIIVTDALNFRVQIFTATGEYQTSFGLAGDSPGHFARPRGVATDSDGNIYVVDALFDNIQIFNKEGALLLAFGTSGKGPGEFWLPAGIYIDNSDKIYVADSYNKRVQIFQYLKQEGLMR